MLRERARVLVKHTNRWHRLLSISKLQSIMKLPLEVDASLSHSRWDNYQTLIYDSRRHKKQRKAKRLDWLEAYNLICLCGLIGIKGKASDKLITEMGFSVWIHKNRCRHRWKRPTNVRIVYMPSSSQLSVQERNLKLTVVMWISYFPLLCTREEAARGNSQMCLRIDNKSPRNDFFFL